MFNKQTATDPTPTSPRSATWSLDGLGVRRIALGLALATAIVGQVVAAAPVAAATLSPDGNSWSGMSVNGNSWSNVSLNGNSWSNMAIDGNSWSSITVDAGPAATDESND